MKLHHVRPAPGSTRERKRVGRGKAAGQGKTAGRGTKGYLAKHNPKPGYEGGQMPLQRRIPKLKGFTPVTRTEFAVVNVERLGQVFDAGAEVDPQALLEHGLVRRGLPVKILGSGDLFTKLVVRANAVSAAARAKIEGAGGSVELI